MRKLILVLACAVIAGSTIANADDKLVDLVKKVKPSVVLIETFDKDNKPIGQGSGFFIDNKGSLITNHHVIEGAYSATIKTSAGKEYPVEGIVAKDTEADIVKLVVNLPDANITFLNLSVNVPSEGEDIFVIGNPLGLESTVSSGIVSAVRDIPAFGKIIQITAPISHGSSGSPVINSKGEVIGIATLIFKEGQNLNFAILSDKIIALKETSKTTLSESYASLTIDANDAQSFYDKGLIELWQENWSAALTYFQKAKETNPQDANVWFYLGYCYDSLGRYEDSIEAYKQATRIKPDDALAHCNLGLAYGNLGRWQEAIEAYKQAIRIKPDYVEAHNNLGVAYGSLGRWQEAMEACKQAIRIKPDAAEAHNNLGVAYGNLGRYQDAIEAYKQAIKIKPDLAEAHCNLGLMYLVTGDKSLALEEYKILKTLDAELANKLFNAIYE
jgi:tetratricopeptide (TPR) repeat protein